MPCVSVLPIHTTRFVIFYETVENRRLATRSAFDRSCEHV